MSTSMVAPIPDVAAKPSGRRWGWAQYLALIGLPFLAVEAWMLVAWLAHGPHQITQFRTPHSGNWWTAQIFQWIAVAMFVGVTAHLVRQCRRERRLTFDAMFVICAAVAFGWLDYSPSLFGPGMLFNSNLLNLNTPLGHLPGMPNPDIGRAPDPLLLSVPIMSAGMLLIAMGMGVIARRIRARRPDISTAQLVLTLFAIALLIDVALEVPLIAIGLWDYPAPSWASLPLGQGLKFPAFEWLAGSLFFLLPPLVRILRDDRGHTVVERGIEHLPPKRKAAVTMLALYGVFVVIALGPGTVPDLAYLPYETAWPQTPRYLLNDACDAPGVTGTRYGPCPGSPGFRLPGRGSLPGPNP